jgi:4-amino-4-deoxy-L-arabinose transferase-like glycosyltransferase
MAWLGQAGWLADNGLIRAVPGLRPDAQFFGHPPGLHFAAAVLFKVFGRSIAVAHVLIACLSAAGVCATYMLVRAAHDTRTAVLAAFLLLFSPAWFSSAGVFLAACRSRRSECSARCLTCAAGWWRVVAASTGADQRRRWRSS